MEQPVFKGRAAPRRGVFSIFALLSVVALGLLAISVLSTAQAPSKFAHTFEDVAGIDFDNADEATQFLASKVRASAGDEFLYAVGT